MNPEEARSILNEHLAGYRKRPYADLLDFVDTTETLEVRAREGTLYRLQIRVDWGDGAKQAIRVRGRLGEIDLEFSVLPDGS